MLKFFKKNINRDKMYASVEGYQINLQPVVNKAKELYNDKDELPSWAKFVENPKKGRGWYVTLIQSMFNGKHNLYGVDIDRLVDSTNGNLSDRRIGMMFFPDNTKVDNLNEIGKITQDVLLGWEVIVLNGKTVKNGGECEDKVDNKIKSTTKNILIISAKMAQRSFSQELIDELYLAYDKGQDGATIQKISRALTSNSLDKIARIFSLSFDPNRDDKLDAMVFQSALNQVEKKDNSNIREELKRIYNSIDIFSCKEDGTAIKFEIDEYVNQALSKKGITRVMGKMSNLNILTKTQIKELLKGNINYRRNEKKKKTEIGKTKDSKSKATNNSKNETPNDSDIKKVREVIVSIIEHSDIIMMAAKNKGAKNIVEAIEIFERNEWTFILENEFGVKYEVIKYLFTEGVIKNEWIDLLHG